MSAQELEATDRLKRFDFRNNWEVVSEENKILSSEIDDVCNAIDALPPAGTFQTKFEYLNL